MASSESSEPTVQAVVEDAPMEKEAEEPAPKRYLVDPEGRELPDPKRSRAAPDESLKMNAIKTILHWHEYMIRTFTLDRNQIDDVADMTSMIWTIHTRFRQEANGTGSLLAKITDTHKFKFKDKNAEFGAIKSVMKAIALLYGFDYGTSDASKAKTGTLGSLLSLFAVFRSRFNEVRTGTNKITLKKVGGNTMEMAIESFGLSARHSVLMNGCTFNPTLQSSLKQSLGPMTVAINLAMQTDRTYQKAWKQTFVSIFKLYPYAHEIAEILAGSKNNQNALLGVIADIALFGTTRASNKASFPVALLLSLSLSNKNYVSFFSGAATPNTPITDDMLISEIKHLDLSGAGAFNFWKKALDLTLFARKGVGMTAKTMSECVFHAVWNTQKEDFGLLHYMTGHHFQTRREMGDQFHERGSGECIKFGLIKFKRICKLASASQTDFLAGSKGQISRAPTFSGRCEQRITLDSDLFKVLLENKEEMTGGPAEVGKILARLAKLKESMARRLSQDGVIRFGTTKFFHYSPSTVGYGHDATDYPNLTGKYFYGQEE